MSPGFIVRFSLPMRKSIVPLTIQTNCSCGCLCAAACAPALMRQYTMVPCSPETTRRRILSVICSSGTDSSLSNPAITGMARSSLLRAAHEGGELAVEARRVLEERRMADALVDRQLRALDHLGGVLGGDQVGVLVLRPVRHQHRQPEALQHVVDVERPVAHCDAD